MLQYLIRVTDNTFPSVVFLALLLLISLKGNRGLRRSFHARGILLGAGAALVYAVLKRNTGIAVREYYDLGVLLPSIPVFLLLAVAGWRSSFQKKESFPFLFRCLACLGLALCTANIMPNIMLYPFDFAVGMDTIFNTEFLYRVMGYSAGLLLMLLILFLVYSLAAKLSERTTLIFFTASLLILACGHSLNVVQILVARNIVYSDLLMELVLFALEHINIFIYLQILVAFFIVAALLLKIKFTPLTGNNPAQLRKMKAGQRRQRRYSFGLLACLVMVALTVSVVREYDGREVELSPPLEIPALDGRILIPLDQVNDGNLHRFMYKSKSGVEVRYIVIKKSESAYGVGLDACDICGPSGYYQRKDQVVCKLCDVVMNISTIGFPGGCNPVPLKFGITAGSMVIMAEDLESEAGRFE